jgi:hypothetical protein
MGKINIRQIIKEELDIALDEMARAKVIYTVNDKSSLEKVVDAVKGNTKLALQYLLDKGEMAVADLAKELKKDPASFNNPGFRKLMSDLSDKNIISVGSVGIPSTPSAPKAEKPSPKVDMTTGDGEVDFEKEIPSDIDVMAGEKELEKINVPISSKFKTPTSDFEDFKTRLKTLVKKIKGMEKGAERNKKMAALKQFIKNPELVKAFKERDVKIDTDGLVG